MTATTEAKPWDFSHVLDLVNSLSFLQELPSPSSPRKQELNPTEDTIPHTTKTTPVRGTSQNGSNKELQSLGDFTQLWQFLGSTTDSSNVAPIVRVSRTDEKDLTAPRHFAGYVSDSALHSSRQVEKSSSRVTSTPKPEKEIAPLHYQSSAEDQTADGASDGSMVSDTPKLTKSQRKKRNRKERREREAALVKEQAGKASVVSVSDSEANHTVHKTPTRPTSARVLDSSAKKQYSLLPRDVFGRAICAADPDVSSFAAVQTQSNPKETDLDHFKSRLDDGRAKSADSPEQARKRQLSNPAPIPFKSNIISADNASSNQQPVTPISGNAYQLVPSTLPPVPHSVIQPASFHPSSVPKFGSALPNHAQIIEPLIARSGEDRHWALLLKLIADFREDRKHLISPMNLTTHNNDPKGIHVFVDASNIFIGFKDQLKHSRGIPHHVQVPTVDLSFDALALLMERRRPVAKRVLVGSTPHLPAFDKAKAVGYECSILEKVYKARELTERQIYFKELDRAHHVRKHAKAPPANSVVIVNGGLGGGSGSGSETNAPQYAPPRMIEQGVDEILHLKILESIVDTDAPSTIVLATGDAARAEYSEGFMKMAERALRKGWTVELVSWSKNISAMYTRHEWTRAWGERFCIVTLDDYAEELLDM